MKLIVPVASIAALFLLSASQAWAEIVTVTLKGATENINDFGDVFGLGAEAVGSPANITDQPFVETLTLNTTQGNVLDTPTGVSYDSLSFFPALGPPYAVAASLEINGHTLSVAGSNYSSLFADPGYYSALSDDAVPMGVRDDNQVSLEITSNAGAPLPTTVSQAFTASLNPAAYDVADTFTDETSRGEYPDAIGSLDPTEITIAPASATPEPSVWMLMLAGVGLAGGALRLRRPRFLSAAAT